MGGILTVLTIAIITSRILVNIRLTRKAVGRTGRNHTILFIASMGQVGNQHRDRLRRYCGLSSEEADIFMMYQWFCLIGMVLSTFLSLSIAAAISAAHV